ncbi:MAG: transposase domain-containing protein [Alphaproteobacteria bacterium]|nr:transposase domain-containing protein [Alphaproteobacteria bacterium]
MFFKTRNSAAIWSGLSSIVRTCEANGINGFAYFNWIQTNWKKVQKGCKQLPTLEIPGVSE